MMNNNNNIQEAQLLLDRYSRYLGNEYEFLNVLNNIKNYFNNNNYNLNNILLNDFMVDINIWEQDKAIFNQLPSGVILTSLAPLPFCPMNRVYLNQSAALMLGYRQPQEVTRMQIASNLASSSNKLFEVLLNKQECYSQISRWACEDGRIIESNDNIIVKCGQDGSPSHLIHWIGEWRVVVDQPLRQQQQSSSSLLLLNNNNNRTSLSIRTKNLQSSIHPIIIDSISSPTISPTQPLPAHADWEKYTMLEQEDDSPITWSSNNNNNMMDDDGTIFQQFKTLPTKGRRESISFASPSMTSVYHDDMEFMSFLS